LIGLHPQPTLTAVQKADNRAISQLRVAIEHAIAGLKRYNILVHCFRNHRTSFLTERRLFTASVCCALSSVNDGPFIPTSLIYMFKEEVKSVVLPQWPDCRQ
jgi:hypothetical protein